MIVRRPSYFSLRVRVLLLVALTMIPVAALVVWQAVAQHRVAEARAHADVERLVRVTAGNQQRLIDGAHQLLIALSRLQQAGGAGADRAEFFSELRQQYPAYANIGVVNPDGMVVASAIPFTGAVNLADDEFIYRVVRSLDFSIGEYRIDPITKNATIHLGYPVVTGRSKVRSIVFVTLDLSWLERLTREANIPKTAEVTVLDSGGTILASYPDNARWIGTSARETPLAGLLKSDSARAIKGLDGKKRVVAVERFSSTGEESVYLAIGLAEDEVFAASRRVFLNGFLGLLAVLLCSLLGAWVATDRLVTRRVRLLVLATRRLSYGGRGLHTGLARDKDEIGELARAFEEMDTSIRHHEKELVETNEYLARTNRELEQFAYVASHDLQEPLRKIMTFSERLKSVNAKILKASDREYFDRMQIAATRMRTLIEDLLNFSRATDGSETPGPVDLGSVIQEILQDYDVRLAQCGGKVEIDPLPVVRATRLQMRQLFYNLIGNSLKFCKKSQSPVIHISAKEDGEWSQIRVEDNGIGFDEKYVEKIFKPFQRLHNREEYEGTGIGLAICQKIVERYHGELSARSRPGQGAIFCVKLPVFQPTNAILGVSS